MEVRPIQSVRKTQFRIYSTDKVAVICTSKVASRYLSGVFKDIGGYENNRKCSNEFHVNDSMEIEHEKNLEPCTELSAYDEINLILNKKSKKDIIFLYRNPMDRIKTGLVQDFKGIFNASHSSIYQMWLLISSALDIDRNNINEIQPYIDFFNKMPDGHKTVSEFLEDGVFYDNVKKLLESYIEYNMKYEFNRTTHVSNYLDKLYCLVFNSGADTRKIKLVNIDAGPYLLQQTLLPYFEGFEDVFETVNKQSNNVFIKMVNEILNENQRYEKQLLEYVSSDILFYNLLKKSNLNAIPNPKDEI